MSEEIPYIQEVDICVGKMPLPCAACKMVTAHEVKIKTLNAIVGVIDITYLCLGCEWGWTGRVSIVDNFAEHDRELRSMKESLAAKGKLIQAFAQKGETI